MIILGYTTKGKVLQTSSFVCPKCNGRRYELTEYKRYFTIFFVPLFPLVKVGDAAVCSSCKTAFVPEAILVGTGYQPQPQTDVVTDHKAALVKRGFSWLVDNLAAVILCLVIDGALNISSTTGGFFVLYTLGWFIYGIACDMALGGRTIGKMFFYIQVKGDDESEITLQRILIRNLVKAPTMYFGLPIPVFTILLRDDRKSFHDLVAGTNVFEVTKLNQQT